MSRAVDEFGRASHRLPQVWPFVWRKVIFTNSIICIHLSVTHCPMVMPIALPLLLPLNQRFFNGSLGALKFYTSLFKYIKRRRMI
jgi:hypothetical protein